MNADVIGLGRIAERCPVYRLESTGSVETNSDVYTVTGEERSTWGYRNELGTRRLVLDRGVDNCWRKMSVNCRLR